MACAPMDELRRRRFRRHPRRLTLAPIEASPIMAQAVNIFIVEDSPVVRERLVEMVADERALQFAGCAATAVQALERIALRRPDVVLLDLKLHEGRGIEVLEAIRRLFP